MRTVPKRAVRNFYSASFIHTNELIVRHGGIIRVTHTCRDAFLNSTSGFVVCMDKATAGVQETEQGSTFFSTALIQPRGKKAERGRARACVEPRRNWQDRPACECRQNFVFDDDEGLHGFALTRRVMAPWEVLANCLISTT